MSDPTVFERYSPVARQERAAAPVPDDREAATKPDKPLYSVLSLDGGGNRGLVALRVLAELEKKTGKPTGEMFDLITGTSAGGIIALGLTMPDPINPTRPKYWARDLLPLFADRSEEIFKKNFFSPILNLFRRRYDSAPARKLFEEYFGETTTAQAVTDILVHTYDVRSHEPVQIRTRKFGRDPDMADKAWNYRNADAALATSAAPTYFEPVEVKTVPAPGRREPQQQQTLIDGGIYANNPAVFGLKEAQKLMPRDAELFVVSVGTGSALPEYKAEDVKGWGPASWINPLKRVPLLNMVFNAQARGADQVMRTALGDRYVRIDGDLLDQRLGKEAPAQAFDDSSPDNIRRLQGFADLVVADHRETLARVAHILTHDSFASRAAFRDAFHAENAPRPISPPAPKPAAAPVPSVAPVTRVEVARRFA